ncbi:TPA: hypothetical protein ACH3X2_003946 [Trebouxia sp. C0005]
MDSQLEAVRQDIGSVKDEIVKTKQDLAAAEQAGNKGKERVLLDLLLSLNNQLLSLQEEKHFLLRNQAPSLSHQWRHKHFHSSDVDLHSVNGRLTRVFLTSTNECIGTAARIRQDGLCVSARHVFVNGGAFLEAKGWDSQLQFVASSPHDDIILLQGPPGEHFVLAQSTIQIVTELASATYQGALPNSSGAPVLDDTRTLRGVHIGTSFHLDTAHQPAEKKLVIQAMFETNVNELWEEEQDLDQPATQDAGQETELESSAGVSSASSALDALTLAQHSCANIQHKAFVALFVPSHRLVAILQALQMLPNDPLMQSSYKLSDKHHRNKTLCA